MSTQHTPGPWLADTSHAAEWEGVTIWADDVVVAHVVSDQHQERDANARLIAAAPALLEAGNQAWEALRDILNAADHRQPYNAAELAELFGPALNALRNICEDIRGGGI